MYIYIYIDWDYISPIYRVGMSWHMMAPPLDATESDECKKPSVAAWICRHCTC